MLKDKNKRSENENTTKLAKKVDVSKAITESTKKHSKMLKKLAQ